MGAEAPRGVEGRDDLEDRLSTGAGGGDGAPGCAPVSGTHGHWRGEGQGPGSRGVFSTREGEGLGTGARQVSSTGDMEG